MIRTLRAAWTIARRDYVATVFTRTFLLFLVTPLLPFAVIGLIGVLSPEANRAEEGPPIVVSGSAADLHLLTMARTRIAARLGRDWLPPLVADAAAGPVRLSGPAAAPTLAGPRPAIEALKGRVGLLVDTARALGAGMPAPVPVRLREISIVAPARDADRRSLARGTQLGMFFLTAILAGMLISNLVEEKSSKVIEVLAAAVPVDAIFLGKLLGMLGVSLTGIAVWGTAGLVCGMLALPAGVVATPAVGWPAFVALVGVYWALLYLLLGALYLGIGAQAGSVREVQTLSLPLTFGQLLFFGLGQAAAGRIDGPVAWGAAALPWSSPFAFAARAAERPDLLPHALGIGWQLLCLFVVVRIAARMFRRRVLRSGGADPRKWRIFSYMGAKRRAT